MILIYLLLRLTTFVTAQSPLVLFHSTFDDAAAVYQPAISQANYATQTEAVPGMASGGVVFTEGAAVFPGLGYEMSWPIDCALRIRGENFEFDDPQQDGGRFDVRLRFDEDIHTGDTNTWIMRTNWGARHINFEFAGNPHRLMIDVYGEHELSTRSSFIKFRILQSWNCDNWGNIQMGEWNWFTFAWRRNRAAAGGGIYSDAMWFWINGQQPIGCAGWFDYNGELPPADGITDLFFSPPLSQKYTKFSTDEAWAFSRYSPAAPNDVGVAAGSVPTLQVAEGVVITFPWKNDHAVPGEPLPYNADIMYEYYFVKHNQWLDYSMQCSLYIDDVLLDTTVAYNGAHSTFFVTGNALTLGTHFVNVTCIQATVVLSSVNRFSVNAEGSANYGGPAVPTAVPPPQSPLPPPPSPPPSPSPPSPPTSSSPSPTIGATSTTSAVTRPRDSMNKSSDGNDDLVLGLLSVTAAVAVVVGIVCCCALAAALLCLFRRRRHRRPTAAALRRRRSSAVHNNSSSNSMVFTRPMSSMANQSRASRSYGSRRSRQNTGTTKMVPFNPNSY